MTERLESGSPLLCRSQIFPSIAVALFNQPFVVAFLLEAFPLTDRLRADGPPSVFQADSAPGNCEARCRQNGKKESVSHVRYFDIPSFHSPTWLAENCEWRSDLVFGSLSSVRTTVLSMYVR